MTFAHCEVFRAKVGKGGIISSIFFINRMASKYSELAVQSKQGEEISGEEGDLVPYLIAKTSLSKPEVLTVISEFIFAGVDTVSLTQIL